MGKFEKTVSLEEVSKSKLERVTVTGTGIELDLDMNIQWEDFKVISDQMRQSQDPNNIDELEASLSILMGMIKDWNLIGKDGKKAPIDAINLKKIGAINVVGILEYVKMNSGYGGGVKKKNS